MPQFVLLASDSRFTLPKTHDDRGRKAYPLGGNAGFVFAGDVLAAQHAEPRMREFLKRKRGASHVDTSTEIAAILRTAYEGQRAASEAGRRPSPGPLVALFGIFDHGTRQAYAVQISSHSGFNPIYVPGIVAAGKRSDIATVRRALNEAQDESLERRDSKVLSDDTARFHMASALSEVIDSTESTTVGGRVQMLVVSHEGVYAPGTVAKLDGADRVSPLTEDNWVQVTTPMEAVFPFKPTYSVAGAAVPLPEEDLEVETWLEPPSSA